MPKKSKKTKEPKKATKKIKQTVKQSVKQSVVIKIGDTPKKKRKYTRKQGPAVKAPAPERQSTSLQPTIYQAPVQPISRLDPNNQAVQASIQQFDKMSQSLNETLQKLNNPNLLKRTIELEGEQGGLVPTERQTLPEQPEPPQVEEEPEQTPIRTYQPPSLFNQPTTQQPEVSPLLSGTITGTITPTAPNEITEDEYNKIVSEMNRMSKLQVQGSTSTQFVTKKTRGGTRPGAGRKQGSLGAPKATQIVEGIVIEPQYDATTGIPTYDLISSGEAQRLKLDPISANFQGTGQPVSFPVNLGPIAANFQGTGQANKIIPFIKKGGGAGGGAEEQLEGLETIQLEGVVEELSSVSKTKRGRKKGSTNKTPEEKEAQRKEAQEAQEAKEAKAQQKAKVISLMKAIKEAKKQKK